MSTFPSNFSDKQLLDILAQANTATAIHSTDEMIIETANDAMIAIWGKDRGVIGLPIEDALPELKGQPFLGMLQSVLHTGKTIAGSDTRADLVVNGKLQPFYFDFEYRAIKDNDGTPICVLHTALDVTQRYLGRQRELELESELQATNEELAAANEELAAQNEEMASTNEELVATNEELSEYQQSLLALNDDIKESEARFRSVITQAPVGICIISASDMAIMDVNSAFLKLVGKTRAEMENHTIWQAVPESAATYAPVMNTVIETGVSFVANEHELLLVRDGVEEPVFVNFVYEPIRGANGEVRSIMVLGVEITEQVNARNELQLAKDTLKQAIDSADIGTWNVDMDNDALTFSDQGRKMQGIPDGIDITLEQGLDTVMPDYIEQVRSAIQKAIETRESFDNEYMIQPMDGSKPRWLKSTGKAYYDDEGKVTSISGTMMDITVRKAQDQQKDDFISIASHELKTPVTSLKAALQLLDKMKENPSPVMLPKLIEQSNRSMDKISTLIEDLLNLSRMNEGQLKLVKSKFNIHEMLAECCNHIRVAGKYELKLEGDTDIEIFADEHRIDQVVVNMVNNSVKYAPNSRQIFLKVEKVGSKAKISVRDTGPGIPAEKQQHLFERYYRTDAAGYQNSGLGLGLYISAEIVRKHGGEIGVTSEVGQGSTFWFTVPL